MLDIRKIGLEAHQITNNNNATAIAVDILPVYEYVNGKKTNNIIYMGVDVVLPDNSYEKIRVKIKDLNIPLTREELLVHGKKVALKGLTGRIYKNNMGDYAVSATADSLEVLQ